MRPMRLRYGRAATQVKYGAIGGSAARIGVARRRQSCFANEMISTRNIV